MKVLLVLLVVMAAGLTMGVVAGNTLAGNQGSPAASLGSAGRSEISAPPSYTQTSRGASHATDEDVDPFPFPATESSVSQPFSVSQSFAPEARPQSVPLQSHAETNLAGPASYVQGSRQVASALVFTIISAGDVDGDGTVDIADMLLLSRALGGPPEQNGLIFDLNGDGLVNVLDLAIVAINLGSSS